jgi:hypothetical protein
MLGQKRPFRLTESTMASIGPGIIAPENPTANALLKIPLTLRNPHLTSNAPGPARTPRARAFSHSAAG